MKNFSRWFVFLCLSFLSAPMPAKTIPVTRDIIKTQADTVFIGVIKKVTRVDSRLLIEAAVVEKLFDRRNDVAGTIVLNFHNQEIVKNFKAGEKYVFVASTCGNGAHILLGGQFVARVKNNYADTQGWYGYNGKTKLSTLRIEFRKLQDKDHFLTDQICKVLFDCEQRTN